MFSSLKKEAEKHNIEQFGCNVWRVKSKMGWGVLSLTDVTDTQKINWIETRIKNVCVREREREKEREREHSNLNTT